MKEFEDVLKDVEKKIESKRPEYGESWKKMPLYELDIRFTGEFEEWKKQWYERNKKEEYKELLDFIAIALMLATRLKAGGTLEQ